MLTFEGARERFGEALEKRLVDAVGGQGLLFDAARYHLATGGKRLRALLPVWLASNLATSRGAALSAREHEDALDLGVAFELIHNGTLVHDDLQDGDRQRRGQPTVWARYGMPQAVNVGTAMLLLGLARVLDSNAGRWVIADVNLAVLGVVEGQALEFELHEAAHPTVAAWDRMAAGKTGALFGACLLAGARAAGRPEAEADEAMRFGKALGIFFQIQDDLLDLVGDKGREIPATDIAEGKISWPVAWASEHAPPAERERLFALVRAPREATTRAMIEEAVALLTSTGAIAACIEETRAGGRALLGSPWAALLPGLVERVVAPVSHVVKLA